ncbi:MAG: CDP-diacylglycerol--glycerol-3-phosphate 3-phosphatidyltransferase [bacterium]
MTLANRVTLLRIALIPLCLICLLTSLYGLAAIIFVILSASDAIDGFIARKYNQVSELGKQLDPLADKILVLSMLIGLTGIGKADPLPIILICAREITVSTIRSNKVFAAIVIAKWKTVLQLVAIFFLLLNLPLAGFILWLAALLSLVSGGAYLWESKLFKQLKLS